MVKKPNDPPLTLVDSGAVPGASPPRALGKHGRALWDAIQREYRIDDRGGIELLAQICAMQDRVQELADIISRDGPVVHNRAGPKSHPALRDELQGRAFICRQLERLGITTEAVKPIGRPAGGLGIRPWGND